MDSTMRKKTISIFLISSSVIFSVLLAGRLLTPEEVTNNRPVPARSFTNNTHPPVDNVESKPALSIEEAQMLEGMRETISQVAEDFEYNMQFPPYSKPLSNGDWALLNPRAFSPTPFSLDSAGSITAQIETDRYLVDLNDDVSIRLVFQSNDPNGLSLSYAQLSIQGEEESVEAIKMQPISERSGKQVYEAILSPSALSLVGPGETVLVADLTLSDGSPHNAGGKIELFESVAEITGVGIAYIDGAELIIPVQTKLDKGGIYRLNANLFDQSGEMPLLALSAKARLESGEQEVLFKAHRAALEASGDDGPYVLENMVIKQSPAAPGDETRYGISTIENATIPEFAFSAYSPEDYVNAQQQQRLALLRGLAK
jgi:hypothetical protein